MIKTLRITCIIMALLAAILLVFPVLFGVRGNKEIEQFLSSAGAIDKFKESADNRAKNGEKQVSPLVKQAQAFTLFLSPPKPVERPADSQFPNIPRPAVVAPKFKLIGTSYFAAHPELSLALIDEPGKGSHWIRQAAEVGHLIVDQIKDGVVVVKDGQKTFEIIMEKPERGNPLIKGSSADAASSPKPVLVSGRADMPPARTGRQVESTADNSAAQPAIEPEVPASAEVSEEEQKLAEKILAELDAMKVTTEEANRLDNLGEELKNAQPQRKDDPNKYYRKIERARRGRRGPTSPPISPNTLTRP
jgi:hypothetical protein